MTDHGHTHIQHSHTSIGADVLGTKQGIRALKISLVALLLTGAFQVVIVSISGSASLLADTLHNFADAFTSIPLWIAFRLSQRKPTKSLTYGYGKSEDIAGLIIVLVVSLSAAIAIYESIQKLLHAEAMKEIGWVAAASMIGFVGNEIVAQYRISTGRKIGSAALVADGQHSRIDGLTSLAVLVGAVGAWYGFPQADPIMGIVISIAIVGIAIQVGKEMFKRMMDIVDPVLIDKIDQAARHADGVITVHDIRARWIGRALNAELSIGVPGSMSVEEGHAIAAAVQRELIHHIPNLTEASIHVDPNSRLGKDKHTF